MNTFFSRVLTKKIIDSSLKFAKDEKTKENIVTLSLIIPIIGIICMSVFLIPAIIMLIKHSSLSVFVGLMSFSLLGASLVIGYINCRIKYNDNGFVAKNFFGIKRKFKYADITGIRINQHETFLYVGKKKINIDEFAVGGREFLKFVNKKYNQIYKENVPIVPVEKKDIFNGNLTEPENFKVLFIILYAVVAFLFIFFAAVLFTDTDVSVCVQDTMVSCHMAEEKLEMISADGKKYIVRNVPENYDISKIQNLVSENKTATFEVIKNTPEGKEPYFEIKSIECENKVILSKSEVKEFNKKPNLKLLFFVPGMFFVLVTIITLSLIIAARNAKKHPRIARIFFQKNQLTIYMDKKPHHKKKRS